MKIEAAQPIWRRVRRILTRVVLVLVGTYVGVVLLLMALEKSLIFFPTKYPDGDWNPRYLKFEDAWFTAADGMKIHGWYVPCEHPLAYILFAHGNAGNLSHRGPSLALLRERAHVAVMIYDYRGYGRSEGEPDEAGIIADAEAARGWLAKRAGIREEDVVLYGESLGGGVMVDLASRTPTRALILESTFSSLPDVAAKAFPFIPVHLLMRTRLDSASKIGRFRGPLLQMHGDADSIIPYEIGKRLFDQANEPKTFVTLRGHDHNDYPPEELHAAVRRFLEQLPPTE